jgi:sugar lactone lactonase YvrE
MRRLSLLAAALLAVCAVVGGALAGAKPFPETVPLPNGFLPEGIVIGPHATFYAGSRGTGAIYRGNLGTGEGAVLPGTGGAGRSALGLDLDQRGRLFVAGGMTGQAYVYDAQTGAEIAVYQLASPPTFINDVVVTKTGAYFTDSRKAVLFRIPIAPKGELGATAEAIRLSGDIVVTPGQFNLNGIDAIPSGKTLVAVHTFAGKLFTIDPATGVTEEIDLGAADVASGDGLLLDGRTAYVVQNFLNRVAVVRLSPNPTSGEVIEHLTHETFDIPTSIDDFGRRLYLVNARFTTPPTPDTPYWLTQVQKP